MLMKLFTGITAPLARIFADEPTGHAPVVVSVKNTELINDVNLFTLANAISQAGVQASVAISPQSDVKSIQASVDAGSATVVIEVSADNSKWQQVLQLSPVAGTPDGWAGGLPWPYIRANVTALATGPVTVKMGC